MVWLSTALLILLLPARAPAQETPEATPAPAQQDEPIAE
jgi:hypothetical protein